MMEWIVPSVLSQRVSPVLAATSSLWMGFSLSSRRSVAYLFIPRLITIQDWYWSFCKESLWLQLHVETCNTQPWLLTLGQFSVSPRIHPFGVDLSSSRVDVYSRHEPPNHLPFKSMSSTVTKYWSREIFLIKPASSPALFARISSERFSNLTLCRRNRSPCTEFVKIDTTLGATLDSDSSFTSGTRIPVLVEWGCEICWPNSSHQSDTDP